MNLVNAVSAANDKQLVYTYDATGRKLSQTVLDVSGATKTEKIRSEVMDVAIEHADATKEESKRMT